MSELPHPAVLKLQTLDLRAKEALGASLAVSEYNRDLRNTRMALRREVAELTEWLRWNKRSAKTEARREQLLERIAYLESATAGAEARFEVLNAQAAASKQTADRLREHLKATLESGGFEP